MKKEQSLLKSLLKTVHLNESTISTILGALVIVIVGVLIFNYLQQTKRTQQITQEAAQEEAQKIGEVTVEKTEEGKIVPKELPLVYEVQAEDNLWKIAEAKYSSGYNWVDIVAANNLGNPDQIEVGQKLTLPKVEVRVPSVAEKEATALSITGSSYTVQKGDSLWNIAVRAYADGYQWPKIAQANNVTNPDYIEVGWQLQLPH